MDMNRRTLLNLGVGGFVFLSATPLWAAARDTADAGPRYLGVRRLGDGRAEPYRFAACVADLASPTGQWPEAIHPQTGGGCMGDGHHVWAAAEWVLMLRYCFLREEGDTLVLASSSARRKLGSRPLSRSSSRKKIRRKL